MDCKTCGKPVVPKKGAKRPKLYCNETCRSNHWHRERAKAKTKSEEETRNNPFTNAARGRDENGVNNDEKVFPESDRQKKQKGVEKHRKEQQKVISPETQKSQDFIKPKSLEELKALCPKNLKGIDVTIWIGEQRQKYGI